MRLRFRRISTNNLQQRQSPLHGYYIFIAKHIPTEKRIVLNARGKQFLRIFEQNACQWNVTSNNLVYIYV